jgi:hypothetical protein
MIGGGHARAVDGMLAGALGGVPPVAARTVPARRPGRGRYVDRQMTLVLPQHRHLLPRDVSSPE